MRGQCDREVAEGWVTQAAAGGDGNEETKEGRRVRRENNTGRESTLGKEAIMRGQ